MKSFPEDRLAIQLSSSFVSLPVFLTFAISLLLTACAGLSSSQPSATTGSTEKGTLSLSPATVNFGTVQPNSVATSVIRVTNVGLSAETIESATVNPASTFSIQGWTGPVILDPGKAVQIEMIFAPQNAGNYSETLILAMLQPLDPINISVIGASADNSPPSTIGVSLSPTSVALQSGQSTQFAATVTGTSNTAVTWTAVLGSLTSSGLYTAPTVTSQSNDTISAISQVDPTKYASVPVVIQIAYSITDMPPVSWYPFAVSGSLFNQALPTSLRCYGASSNGITTEECAAGDLIAKASLTGAGSCYSSTVNNINCGFLGIGYPGGNGDQNSGYYYCTASTCQWFKVNSTTCPGNPVPLNLSFLAPSGAKYSGNTGDQSLLVYDQLQGLYVQIYANNHGAGANIGTSTCPGTGSSSCAVAISPNISVCSAAPVNTSGYPDWNNGTTYSWNGYTGVGAVNAAGAVNDALDIRLDELATGVINHAIAISIPCQYPGVNGVFPNPGTSTYTLQHCSTPNANEPLPGMLFQLDYTAAQIATMNLSTWQAGIITALSTYGGYAKATQSFTMSSSNGMSVPGTSGEEGPEACFFYGSSWCLTNVFDVLKTQGGKTGPCGTSTYANGCFINASSNSTMQFAAFVFQNIPLAIGPEGTDSSGRSCTTGAGCDVTGHMHALDQCVAKGQLGQAGGCP
jgi:hypothetical protein